MVYDEVGTPLLSLNNKTRILKNVHLSRATVIIVEGLHAITG